MSTPAEKYGLDKPSTDWSRDGNAYSIMGAVARALKSEGYPAEAVDEYREESMSGDYDHLIQTAMKWCDLDSPEDEYDEDEEEVECDECGFSDWPDNMVYSAGRWLCDECAEQEGEEARNA